MGNTESVTSTKNTTAGMLLKNHSAAAYETHMAKLLEPCSTCDPHHVLDMEQQIRSTDHDANLATDNNTRVTNAYKGIFVEYVLDLRHVKGGMNVFQFLRSQITTIQDVASNREMLEMFAEELPHAEHAFNQYVLQVLEKQCYREVTSTNPRCLPLGTDPSGWLNAMKSVRYMIDSLVKQFESAFYSKTKTIL
jgi:hypothetical protein